MLEVMLRKVHDRYLVQCHLILTGHREDEALDLLHEQNKRFFLLFLLGFYETPPSRVLHPALGPPT